MLDDLQINLFGIELLYDRKDFLCCDVLVCDSSSVHCAPVVEVRRLLDL